MSSDKRTESLQGLAKFLNPESLKENLILASLFICAYETLRASIIDQIRDFFITGFDENGLTIHNQYNADVLSKDKSLLRASLLWLKEHAVLNDEDIDLVDEIREHRNKLAHNLPEFITTTDANINVRLLISIFELVIKIDRWWIVEIEIPTNPHLDGQMIDYSDVVSGRTLFLKMMVEIATGQDSGKYWDEFQEQSKRFLGISSKLPNHPDSDADDEE